MQAFGAMLVVAAYFLLSIISFLMYSLIGEGLPLIVAVGVQNSVILLVLLLRAIFTKKLELPKKPKWILFRSISGVLYSFCYYSALGYASFAEVGVLTNSFPLFIVLIAWLFLGEKVGITQWVALVFGIIGVWTILFANIGSLWNFGILFATLASLLFAVSMILMQKISEIENVSTYLYTFFSINLFIMLPFILRVFQMPTSRQCFFCIVAAFLTLLAQALLFTAYKMCSAAELAPYNFSFAFFHFLLAKGFFAFSPTIHFYIGALLILLGGAVNLIVFERKGDEVEKEPSLEMIPTDQVDLIE